jgi:hypothetical protein
MTCTPGPWQLSSICPEEILGQMGVAWPRLHGTPRAVEATGMTEVPLRDHPSLLSGTGPGCLFCETCHTPHPLG